MLNYARLQMPNRCLKKQQAVVLYLGKQLRNMFANILNCAVTTVNSYDLLREFFAA